MKGEDMFYTKRSADFSRGTDNGEFILMNTNNATEISLEWQQLSYSYSRSFIFKLSRNLGRNSKSSVDSEVDSRNIIVQRQSGRVKSGELVAIIGPSGAGKTTLLECLSGRRQRGLYGSVYVTGGNLDTSISMLSQSDFLLDRLTVAETLTFAAKFKLGNANNVKDLVDSMLLQLNLKDIASQLAIKCSGGERKRISIGTELISQPKILVLDEPTSGLDSTSAFQCVQLLKQLATEDQLAIIASVHQPSASLLSIFHRVMVVSNDGRMLYFDDVQKLHPYLASLGYHCPPLHNIADYAIELASGLHGQDAIDKLYDATSSSEDSFTATPTANPVKNDDEKNTLVIGSHKETVRVNKIIERMHYATHSAFLQHLWFLTHRTVLVTLREPWLNLLRFLAHILIAIFVSFLYSGDVGQADGCVHSLKATTTADMNQDFLSTVSHIQIEEGKVMDNLSFHLFSLLFLMYTSMMCTAMVFPLEVTIFIKEYKNGCYSVISYYLGKTVADAPFTLLNSTLYMIITYYCTGQIQIKTTFLLTLCVYVLISFIGQSLGMLIGALWAHEPDKAVFVAPVSQLPFVLLSGYFIKITSMPPLIQIVSYISYWRYAFEIVVQLTYGLERCTFPHIDDKLHDWEVFSQLRDIIREANIDVSSIISFLTVQFYDRPELISKLGQFQDDLIQLNLQYENGTHSDTNISKSTFYQGSFVMSVFSLTDDNLWCNISALLMFIIIIRISAYIALCYKTTITK